MHCISIKANTIISIFNGISALIFLILCTQAGGLIFNSIYLLLKPDGAEDMYLGLDIEQLFSLSQLNFLILFLLTVAVIVLKAYVFALTMLIFSTLNLVKPFSEEIALLILRISYLTLAVGILGFIAFYYSEWLESKGFELSSLQFWWDDNLAYLMMGTIVFVLAQVFKKGLELQAENDLTV